MTEAFQVVLAGNPNCGKSTLFNALTGAKQSIGNFPGVTVDLYEGSIVHQGKTIHLIDLPGVYSLATYNDEEKVAAEYLNTHQPDLVVNVVDASNLERNLYLTLLLKDRQFPMVVVLNMMDVARRRGNEIDVDALSRELGLPVFTTVGNRGVGVDAILDAVLKYAGEKNTARRAPDEVSSSSASNDAVKGSDEKKDGCCGSCSECCGSCHSTFVQNLEKDVARYRKIGSIQRHCVANRFTVHHSSSDRIDKVLTHRIWGIPIFLLSMFIVFQLTFAVGQYPMNWIEAGISRLTDFIALHWSGESVARSLVLDGVIGGVGGVIVFLPNILILFFSICLLEDSGYMARAAVLSDRWMHKIGLHGRSVVPLLVGFGCNVPAMMVTKMIADRRERLTTLFVLPFFSCSARFPIYMMIIPAFFPQAWRGPILWLMYLIGIVLAALSAKVLSILFKKRAAEEDEPFLIELVPYHRPTLQTVGMQTLERGWQYIKKAGTVILGFSILFWFLTFFPKLSPEQVARYDAAREAAISLGEKSSMTEEEKGEVLAILDRTEAQGALNNSFAGRLGNFLEPLLRPMGFDWRIGTSLIGAVAAKEIFVAQMGIVFSVGEPTEENSALTQVLAKAYSPVVGFCIMLFCLIATPCLATFTMMAKEAGSWKWAFAQWGYMTLLAWVITTIVYQIFSRI